ncbi:MAG: rhomboid family intramembrane serine protease [Candidatus Eisenbacteria bacterium]|uniref:Rhomboid family intramembrane serine protease n=1 Tax=Eiseniibacteriota bacterium TaxID=2212470 RepID=A0A9D6QI69_UNCEI|nr:rhomboid family intramembrane serine protease [Candidatus Eisenbacteria bacterium]MBI3538957.1 rhomboid family intramembrane serine protease [Candidatus Eisenbacteria bacterium]
MRQTSGSMICPQCGKLISVTEEKCPFCGAWRPGLYGFTPAMNRWFGGRVDLIAVIIIGCIALYGVSLLLQPEAIFQSSGFLSFLSPGTRALYQLGMTGGLAWQQRWWWTLLTAIYLHGGILHIFFNVMWIRNLGPAVTEAYGPARAFVIFSVAGAAGFLLSNVVSGHESIGASGSIFGLMSALIVYGRQRGHAAMTAQLWQWAIIVFAMGFFMRGVNNWAHLGGFAGGWVTALGMRFSERREGRGVQLLALALLAATAAGIGLSFLNVTSILLRR